MTMAGRRNPSQPVYCVGKGLNSVDLKRYAVWAAARRLPTRSVTVTGNKACVSVCQMAWYSSDSSRSTSRPLPNGTSRTEEQAPFANLFAPASGALRVTSVLELGVPDRTLLVFLRLVPFPAHDTRAPGPAPSRGSTSRFKSGRWPFMLAIPCGNEADIRAVLLVNHPQGVCCLS